jgi:hypothetical protein
MKAARAFGQGGFAFHRCRQPHHLQLHGAQLQPAGSQEQGLPFWQPLTLTLALWFFDWRLRFVFIVIDFRSLRRVPVICCRVFPAVH